MNFKHLFSGITVGLCLVTVSIPLDGCAQKSDKQSTENTMSNDSRMNRDGGRPGGPQLGTPGGGPVIDKTGDETLQAMIKDELPFFKQMEYTDSETGKSMKYNLYSPNGEEKAVLQRRQSVWRSPQNPTCGCVKLHCATMIPPVKAQGQGGSLHSPTEVVKKHLSALCLYPYMLNEGMLGP